MPVNPINASSVHQIRARVNKTLTDGIQIDMSTEESKKLLRRHVNTKTHFVIMITDINKSTEMSFLLPEDKFATIIQTFAQETSITVAGFGGYVFKYEGDAQDLHTRRRVRKGSQNGEIKRCSRL